jgi:hypothetical protein
MKTIPDPPRLSTFKRRGGGGPESYAAFRRPRSRRPDQRRSCNPALLSCLVLNQCGPSSRHFILPSSFPLLPCVIHSPPLFGLRGLTFFSPPTRSLPRVPLLSTSASHPKANSFLPSSSLSPDVFRHESSSIILLSSRHIFHALIAQHHHPRHVPHPPRWPPCLFHRKPVCYSMWQREESSISQSAELAGLSSIPRSSY